MPAVLLFTAPVGGGKTSTMLAASELLQGAGVPHAAVDVDALSWCYPRRPDDPYGSRIALRNLGWLWREYAAAGATHLLLARVIEGRSDLAAFAEVLPGARITVARLRADVVTVQARLRVRDSAEELEWGLRRSAELAEALEGAAVEDFVVDNDDRPPRDVAADVLRRAGWPAQR